MRGQRIDIPWFRRTIIAKADLDNFNASFNFNLPKTKPTNTPQPELSPEPAPQPQPNPNPNPNTNPNPNPGTDPTKIMLPIEIPGGITQTPTGQPFPVPKGIPVGNPFRRPGSKPNQQPNTKPIPAPRRNPMRRPVRTPAAAIDLLSPEILFPAYETKPWEIIPVGGLTPIKNIENESWLNPVIGYATEVGVDANQFKEYMISYDYGNFSVKGMYSDLSGMYGQVAAAILIGYIIASIPLGVPGVPGI